MNDIKQVELSQEELLFLLRKLQLPDLSGMGKQPWQGIPEEKSFEVMMEAGRSLLDREIQHLNDQELVIEPDVIALLEACAYPEKMVVINYRLGDRIGEICYCRRGDKEIKHTLPSARVHLFELVDDSDMGQGILQDLLIDRQLNKSSHVTTARHDDLNQVKDLTQGSMVKATEKICELGIEPEAADRLAMAFANSELKIRLQVYFDLKVPSKQTVISLFIRSDSCWMVTSSVAGSNALQVKEVTSEELNKVIQTLFYPFSEKISANES